MEYEPITREEMFLSRAGGYNVEVPEPITRKEMFLQKIIENTGSGGSGGGSSGGGGSLEKTFTVKQEVAEFLADFPTSECSRFLAVYTSTNGSTVSGVKVNCGGKNSNAIVMQGAIPANYSQVVRIDKIPAGVSAPNVSFDAVLWRTNKAADSSVLQVCNYDTTEADGFKFVGTLAAGDIIFIRGWK